MRPSIVGGSPAPTGSFPWLAFIADVSNGAANVCSGTVVSPDVVLTAGHCGEDLANGAVRSASDYRVVTGSLDWTDPSRRQVLGVARVIVYPGYNRRTGTGDAALLVLRTPTTAPPIRLAGAANVSLVAPGTAGAIAGWGETASGSLEGRLDLRLGPWMDQDAGAGRRAPARRRRRLRPLRLLHTHRRRTATSAPCRRKAASARPCGGPSAAASRGPRSSPIAAGEPRRRASDGPPRGPTGQTTTTAR